jgi:hypothetical protein
MVQKSLNCRQLLRLVSHSFVLCRPGQVFMRVSVDKS